MDGAAAPVGLAITFGALGIRYPVADGVSAYARAAFGESASRVTGVWSLTAAVLGAPAVALIGGYYVADLVGGGSQVAVAAALAMNVVVLAANAAGLRWSSGAQLILSFALVALVMNMFEEGAERNKALGIWGDLGAGGATVGLILGGLLTRYAGWQYIFYLNVPIGVAALALAPRIVPDSRLSSVRRRFDAAGALVGTGGLVLLVDAISQAPQYGWGATRTIVVLAASAALLVAFVLIESRAKEPVLPLSIFRLRTLAGANVAGLLLGGSLFAFIFVGTLYMQQVLHYSALQTGVAWLAASLTSVALAGVSQWLVTRGGAKIVMAVRMTLIGAGVLWATQVPVHGRFVGNLLGPLMVAGAGTAFAFIPISIAALAGVEEHPAGLASGLLNTSEQLGGAIGIAIASSVAASHTHALLRAGGNALAALTGGFQQALWVLGRIGLLAVPATFALVRRNDLSDVVAKTAVGEPQPALAGAS
jgi:MFS family permease